jgi:hypothetical protein
MRRRAFLRFGGSQRLSQHTTLPPRRFWPEHLHAARAARHARGHPGLHGAGGEKFTVHLGQHTSGCKSSIISRCCDARTEAARGNPGKNGDVSSKGLRPCARSLALACNVHCSHCRRPNSSGAACCNGAAA